MYWLHELLLHHVMCNFYVRKSCSLTVASLKHVQLFLLNGEFKVLNITKLFLKSFANLYKLLVGITEDTVFGHSRHWKRSTDTGNDILTLCIHKILTIKNIFACCGVTGEGNTCCAVITHIPEHHCLYVDRSAPLIWNFVFPSIDNSSLIHPATEYRSNGTNKLFERILWEAFPSSIFNEPKVSLDQFAECFL